MPTITDVRFAHEDGALVETLTRHPDVAVRVLPETSTDPDRDLYVLRFDNADEGTIESALEHDHTVCAVESMPEVGDRNLWAVEFAADTELLAPQVTREGGFVIDARSSRHGGDLRGWHERWLVPDREAVHSIWQHAREAGFEFEVLDLQRGSTIDSTYPIRDLLTDQQCEALLEAYERGYYEEPREASLEDVGNALGYSPSAVSGRLKRGMKSLVEATLVVDRARQ